MAGRQVKLCLVHTTRLSKLSDCCAGHVTQLVLGVLEWCGSHCMTEQQQGGHRLQDYGPGGIPNKTVVIKCSRPQSHQVFFCGLCPDSARYFRTPAETLRRDKITRVHIEGLFIVYKQQQRSVLKMSLPQVILAACLALSLAVALLWNCQVIRDI